MLKPWTEQGVTFVCLVTTAAVLMDNKLNYCYDDIKIIDHVGNSLKIPEKNIII